jgi:soluble lytic murein transglycosylase-like protein
MQKLIVVLGISLFSFVLVRSAAAQESSAPASGPVVSAAATQPTTSIGTDKQTVPPSPAGNQAGSPKDSASTAPPKPLTIQTPATSASSSSNDYKSSLDSLSTLYQNEVQRLEKQNATSKDLYKDGLISRVEMEKSDKALADARAKVEDIAKQIAEANKPALIVVGDSTASIHLNNSWTTGNARIDGLIRYYGNQHGVDPYLIFCLMSQESKFTSGATSPKGAQGLMQLMPGTAARYGVTNPYDVAQSISGGTRYLKDLLKMFNGRIDLALAGYNAGEGAVIKYGYNIPPYDETRNYVKLIIKRYGRVTSQAPTAKSEPSTKPS